MGDGAAVGQRLYEAALRVRRPSGRALLTRNGQEMAVMRVLWIMPVISVHERRLGRGIGSAHGSSLTDMVSCRTGSALDCNFSAKLYEYRHGSDECIASRRPEGMGRSARRRRALQQHQRLCARPRSEEHTSELQSLMRTSYA